MYCVWRGGEQDRRIGRQGWHVKEGKKERVRAH